MKVYHKEEGEQLFFLAKVIPSSFGLLGRDAVEVGRRNIESGEQRAVLGS